ncbi:MAG: rhodanese-like domain-containing protein [Planctomycetaceae bacterium]|jgi:rhodanese-related sulfurtransferase
MRIHQLAITVLVLCAGSAALAAEHTKDSLATVKKNIKAKKAVLVDVREVREWNAGHIKGAKLVPLSKLAKNSGLKELLKTLPKDKILYTHCKSGVRCLGAADVLKKSGFKVRALKPGYVDLVKAGFPKAK